MLSHLQVKMQERRIQRKTQSQGHGQDINGWGSEELKKKEAEAARMAELLLLELSLEEQKVAKQKEAANQEKRGAKKGAHSE